MSPLNQSRDRESLGMAWEREINLPQGSPAVQAWNGQTTEPQFCVTINEPAGSSSLLPSPLVCPKESFDFWAYSTPKEKLSYIYTADDLLAIQRQLKVRALEFRGFDMVTPRSVEETLLSVVDEEEWMTRARFDNPQGLLRNKPKHFATVLRRDRNAVIKRIQDNVGVSGRTLPVYWGETSELLGYWRCGACGFKGHPAGGYMCPIGNLHSVVRVLTPEVPASFFRLFPCNYCGGKFHSLVVCPNLHSLCRRCRDRGHTARSGECLDDSHGAREKRQQRFDFYKSYGLLTKTLPLYYGFEPPFINMDLWETINADCAERAQKVDVVREFYNK